MAAAFLVAASLAAAPAAAQSPRRPSAEDEIAPFRFTGFEGYALMSFMRDGNSATQDLAGAPSQGTATQVVSLFRTDVFLMTHGYVYLPGLLSLDMGAGPILDRTAFETNDGRTASTKGLYNLSLKATALRDKPYRGKVFYEHLNPTQIVGPAQVMFVESDRFGFDFSLLEPVTPVPLLLEAERFENKGRGSGQVQDDRIDQVKLRASRRITTLGDTVLRLERTRQESASGSTLLPIQTTSIDRDGLSLDTRLRFLQKGTHDFEQNLALNSTTYSNRQGAPMTEFRDLRFANNLASTFSDQWQTSARYVFTDSRIDTQATSINSLAASVSYRATEELQASFGTSGEFAKSTQLDSARGDLNGTVNWRRALPAGQLSASYGFSYSLLDQQAKQPVVAVSGERVALTGTSFVQLAARQVNRNTIVVSNQGRTQVFVEGIDYLVTVLGLVTRIQRTVNGAILDGQEVLVDYQYDTGGTYRLARADQNLNLKWTFRNYLSAYARFGDDSPRVESGSPTFPLNPARTTLYGARADVPLPVGDGEVQVGGLAEREDRRETVSPYRRSTYEAYVMVPVPFVPRSTLRVGGRRSTTDYDFNPLQGVNAEAWDVHFATQPFFGLDLSVDVSRERDTGTPILRERRHVVARATWRVRKARLSFDLRRTYDAQGETQRSLTYAQLVLRRDF